jgi:hypothetical protein
MRAEVMADRTAGDGAPPFLALWTPAGWPRVGNGVSWV